MGTERGWIHPGLNCRQAMGHTGISDSCKASWASAIIICTINPNLGLLGYRTHLETVFYSFGTCEVQLFSFTGKLLEAMMADLKAAICSFHSLPK